MRGAVRDVVVDEFDEPASEWAQCLALVAFHRFVPSGITPAGRKLASDAADGCRLQLTLWLASATIDQLEEVLLGKASMASGSAEAGNLSGVRPAPYC